MKSLLIAICLFGLAGCGQRGTNDAALTTDIQAKLYADPAARTANVKVSVANGVVTLTGDAPSSDVALKVVDIANGVSGIKSVSNQLNVAPSAMAVAAPEATGSMPAPAPPAGSPSTPVAAPPMAGPASPTPQAPRAGDAPMAPPAMAERREPPRPLVVTIPAGTNVGVQMIDGISSKKNKTGETFRASLAGPVVVDGKTVFAGGSDATVALTAAKGAGRIKGNSELEVRLVSIQSRGKAYQVDSSVHDEIGKGRGKQSAVRTGIGAAAGAVIGALAGGGKGAAIGSVVGGAGGAGVQLATHGQQVTIPAESVLTFSLQSPIEVTMRREHDGERERQ